jgi:ribosomal protein L7/L12
MADIIITGWKPDLEIISLIRLLRRNSTMGLKEAKDAFEGLIDGKEIRLSGLSEHSAAEVRKEIESLNFICR